MRYPVRKLIVANNTRLALLPVIGIGAWCPRNDHARRKTGNSRKMVSSSIKSTASGGIRFNCLTIALFSVRREVLFQNTRSADAYIASRWRASSGAKCAG